MRINAVAFSTNGCRTALRLKEALKGDDVRIYCKTTSDSLGVERIEGKCFHLTHRKRILFTIHRNAKKTSSGSHMELRGLFAKVFE